MSGAAHVPAEGQPLALQQAAAIGGRLAALRASLGERAPAEATFWNLWLFREAHGYRYHPGPLPCIAGNAYDETQVLLPLFDLAGAPREPLGVLQGERSWFYPVPEPVLAQFDPAGIEARALCEDSDYLYGAAAFIDYAAPGLASKQAAVERLHASGLIDVQPLDRATEAGALAVLDGWCKHKGWPANGADAPACRAALGLIGTEPAWRGFLHTVDGVPAGFVIGEDLNPGVLAVRFAKGLPEFDGIYPQLFQDLARRLVPGVRWLNFEQDLGRENFRRSKQSYRPVALLAKYRVRFRNR